MVKRIQFSSSELERGKQLSKWFKGRGTFEGTAAAMGFAL